MNLQSTSLRHRFLKSHAEYAVRGVIIHPSLIGKLKVTAKISLGVVYCMNKKVGTKNFFNGANLETVQLINSEKGPPISTIYIIFEQTIEMSNQAIFLKVL